MNSQLFISTILALVVLVSGQPNCDPGTFINGRFCSSCDRGQFQPLPNQDSCEDCPDGLVASRFGSTECTECPEFSMPNRRGSRCLCEDGRVMRRGSCELCEPGTSFQRSFRFSFCEDCQPGTFQPDAGQTECLNCPSGTSSGNGATECITCGDDEFADDRGRCRTCAPGRFLRPFETRCSLCEMNSFKAESGIAPCLPCPSGQFSQRGATECGGCPGNSTLLSNGRCISCPAGSSLNRRRNTCRLCPINTFMPYENIEPNCFRCTGPKFSMEGAAECTRCPQNTGLLQDGTCATCPEGSIYNQRLFKCEECPVNRFSRGNMGFCDSCPTGTFSRPGASTCFACPRGQAFIASSDSCGTCPPGREYRSSTARCRRCFFGDFKPNEGIQSCDFCDSGRSNAARTACVG